MIRSRVQRHAHRGADAVHNRYRQEECTIIGMVTEVKTTTNGHRIAETRGYLGKYSGALLEGSPGLFRCRADHPR
ncbi:MAG: hypothetical protein MZV70_30385 [Desulfobacterales bacterium]|nr:hypothetical protein [Desulfobacterales bacterium]